MSCCKLVCDHHSLLLLLQFLSPHAIAVRTPHSPRPGEVDITLVYKGSQYCINNPGKFVYISKYNKMHTPQGIDLARHLTELCTP